jgi:hypothetical protein
MRRNVPYIITKISCSSFEDLKEKYPRRIKTWKK